MKKDKLTKKNKIINIQEKLDRLFEMPAEILGKEPKITILGFEKMLIENYKVILEYEEFFVRISTDIGIININGFNLKLEEMTTNDLIIKGIIEGIDFETIVDQEV